ncbi:MAG: glycosyltransferase [Pseudomonadota bacterium]
MNSEHKRIALFGPSIVGGGVERVMANLCRGLSEEGFAVDLVVLTVKGPYRDQVPSGVRLVSLMAGRAIGAFLPLVRYLRKERPSVLISHMNYTNVIAICAATSACTGVKVGIVEHGPLSKYITGSFGFRASLIPLLARWTYPRADRILAVSQGVADELHTILGVKAVVVHNPAVLPDLAERAAEPIDHPWFAPGMPPVVISAGRLSAQKDYPTLLRAFRFLIQQREARLVVLGEGEDRADLLRMTHELGIERCVSFPGFVSNPPAYFARSAVFVLSSLWEGQPMVLLEAMGCGTPVVATDCDYGPSEILEGGKLGKLVRVGDWEGLAQAMDDILHAPPDTGMLKRAAAKYTLSRVTHNYMEALEI